jgi:membrane protease YdiL (CAAX protease family)
MSPDMLPDMLPDGQDQQTPDDARTARRRARRELGLYFALVFAITWGIAAALLLIPRETAAVIGPIKTLNASWPYYLAVYAPTVAAAIAAFAFGGWRGLIALARRFARPFAPVWALIAVGLAPASFLLAGALERLLTPGRPPFIDVHAIALTAPVMAATSFVLIGDPGGFGEETGWRGYALPRLLRLINPLAAAIALGVVWAIWHIPAFFAQGLAQSQLDFGWFALGVVSMSVVMTFLFVNANGNVFVSGVAPHLVFNLMIDAHAFVRDVAKVEGLVTAVIALALIVGAGPSLRGWRVAWIPVDAAA